MSNKKPPQTCAEDQHSIKKFTTPTSNQSSNTPEEETLHERVKQAENHEKVKPLEQQKKHKRVKQTPINFDSPKNRTPPSIEAESAAKKLVFEHTINDNMTSENTAIPVSKQSEKPMSEFDKLEVRLIEKISNMINPLQQSIDGLKEDWESHRNKLRQLKTENLKLTNKINKLEHVTEGLKDRVKWLENKLLKNSLIINGITESTWESEEIYCEKVINILARIVPKDTYEERIAVARGILIKSIKRIGRYNPLSIRPVNIVLENSGNTEYILDYKRQLGKGIFVDREYGPETEKERKYLRPILNAARQTEEFKGKCKLEGDALIIQGKWYTRKNLYSLPESINGFKATSRSDSKILAFFGELNPFSNFHPSCFEYCGQTFHSGEQMIQYMKASYFEDEDSADHILKSDTPLECRNIARNIKNYDREKWITVAKELCDGGIREKFRQNPYLAEILLSTGTQTLVEACKDTDWGSGIPLHGDRCLIPQTWYSQGLLGTILEEVRSWLRDTKRGNINEETDTREGVMETT